MISKNKQKQLENIKKLYQILHLMENNKVPGFDLDNDFDMTDWSCCIFGCYRKIYKVKTDFDKVYYEVDIKKRFGFSKDLITQIFIANGSESYTNYHFYVKRAIECLDNSGYAYLKNTQNAT